MSEISSNKTIAKNTIFLYLRMMFIMLVSLYTSRVILEALGVNDFGIYQIVGGVVTAFSFLNSSLSGATSRFLTYDLGRGDEKSLKDTFASALNIHIGLALIIFLLAETIGLWFFENKLVIPEERMNAARIVYQISVLSCMISITQVPYSASLISHEKMGVFAYMSIIDVSFRLSICYLLYIIPYDRLVVYAILMFLTLAAMQLIYRFYCIRHFKECHFKLFYNKEIVKPMLSFSTWDLIGNFGVMMRNNGVNIVLNLFFGPAVNAACGFSGTVQGAVKSFSDNFMTAVRPSIVKTYSIGEYNKMESLMINASKFSFGLMMLLSVPIMFESKFVIDFWLKNPPEYTYEFCTIALAVNLIRVLYSPLVFGIHATGKIRNMSIANGSMLFLIVPISYLLLSLGACPVIPFIVDFFLMVIMAFIDLYCFKQNLNAFHTINYLKKATLPCLTISLPILFFTYFVDHLFEPSLLRFFLVCLVSSITTGVMTYYFLIDKQTRKQIVSKIKSNFLRTNSK